MNPLAVYVETSVWSCAFADDVPDYRRHTLEFFERCRQRMIEPVISPIVLDEIEAAKPELRDKLTALVDEIGPEVADISERAERLAEVFVQERIVPASKPEDARHVACAFDEELDALVSWNFRHIASVRRAERFNSLALFNGFFKPLRIVSPAEVLYDDEAPGI